MKFLYGGKINEQFFINTFLWREEKILEISKAWKDEMARIPEM